MNTIRELKQQEKYKNMLKRKNKEKNIYKTRNETLKIKYEGIKKVLEKQDKEIEKLNNIINRIKSIYSSLCFSAPENNYIFIEELGEVLQELKGSDKE